MGAQDEPSGSAIGDEQYGASDGRRNAAKYTARIWIIEIKDHSV